jgi:signal transduction histidine kinase/ActR/RegA family two-component response regulator
LAGPIELVQGGEAFVNRAPVFEKNPGEAAGTGAYWGLVSLLLDKETLIREILRDATGDLQIAIATVIPADGDRPEELKMFVGSESIEAADPLRLDITLPSGRWQVLGVPTGGWPTRAPASVLFRIGGLIFASIAAVLVFSLLRANFRYHAAQEAAVAASSAKSEFLANMSHEIRTPMTAILGFADELDDIETEDQAREAVQAIRRNGAHLLELINDILDVSKIEAGKLTVERIACSPVTILSEVAELTRPRAEAKGLRFTVRFEGLIPDVVQTDPLRLRQILFNLIANGIKFTECGSVTIGLRLDEADTAAPQLNFTISDTGVGISEEQLPQLFQPFTQADASTSRRFGGTGLGLVISRRLTEMLGGTLSVSSKLGEGTRFVLRIPTGSLQRAHFVRPDARSLLAITRGTDYQTAELKPREPVETNRRPLEGLRLLLAEDGPDNRRLLAFMLGKAGATLEFAEDGRQAIEMAIKHWGRLDSDDRFDLVLMDMQMPEVDGYAATRELRKKGYTVPIIALTAHAMRDDERKCLEAGCTAYMTKPIDRGQLIELILHCLAPANHSANELVH